MNRTVIAIALSAVALTGCGHVNRSAEASQPTATVTVTKTTTVTKEVTPQACRDVLTAFVGYTQIVRRFGLTASGYPPLISDAYGAGISGDPSQAYPVLAKMKRLNAELHQEVADVGPAASRVKTLGHQCSNH